MAKKNTHFKENDMASEKKEIAALLSKYQEEILDAWHRQLIVRSNSLMEIIGLTEAKSFTQGILEHFITLFPLAETENDENKSYREIDDLFSDLSGKMTSQNISPSEIAVFIFSMKEAVFPILQKYIDNKDLSGAIISAGRLIDRFAVNTFEIYLNTREKIISEQQRAFMEISVPVVRVWHRIIMIPLIGMLDSERTQLMMEVMLTALEDTQSKVAILDISGIPVVDTLVARHLITAASAAKLMGAECIITGVRSRIAQTLVQLGVDLGDVVTRTTMSDGLQLALELTGQKIGE